MLPSNCRPFLAFAAFLMLACAATQARADALHGGPGLVAGCEVGVRLEQTETGAMQRAFPGCQTQTRDPDRLIDFEWQPKLDTEHALFVKATLVRYRFRGRFDYGPFDGVPSLDQRGSRFDLQARWHFRGWRGHQLGIGVEVQHNFEQRQRAETDADSGWQADVDDHSRRWSLFVNDEFELVRDLRAVLGARLDRQLGGEVIARPRMAVLWQARPGWMVKTFSNVGVVDADGAELEAEHAHSTGWRLRGSVGLQRTRGPNPNAQLSNDLRSLAKLDLSLPLPRLGTHAGLEWQRTGHRRTFDGQVLPSHAVANVRLQYTSPGASLSASASVQNLFGEVAADSGGPDPTPAPGVQDGRHWRVQLAWYF